MGRVLALAVLLGAIGLVALWHRDDLWPAPAAAPTVPPELQACLDERLGQVEALRAEGTITAEQAGQFAGRAEALCRSQFGDTGPPDRPPGL